MTLFDGVEEIFQRWRSYSDCSRDLVSLATTIGVFAVVVVVLKTLFATIRGLRLYVFSQFSCCQPDYKSRYGKWVAISGSTDGIGLAMAREFARRGHSIIVMGRNTDKLANAKATVEREPNVGEVISVRSDLSDASAENFQRIRAEIDPDNRDIGILVNNAGIFPEVFRLFQSNDIDEMRNAVNLNDIAVMQLTHMTLPGMVNRGRGLVVNISSIFGASPAPYVGIYGPSKALIDSFSKQLSQEYASLPVDIINVSPGPVYTKQFIAANKMGQTAIISPTPESFAKSVVNALSTRIESFCGTPFHELMLKSSAVFECLGLHTFMLKNSLKVTANKVSFSP